MIRYEVVLGGVNNRPLLYSAYWCQCKAAPVGMWVSQACKQQAAAKPSVKRRSQHRGRAGERKEGNRAW